MRTQGREVIGVCVCVVGRALTWVGGMLCAWVLLDPGYNGQLQCGVSLFTRVPIRKAMSLLGRHFENILRLLWHVLTSAYSSVSDQF
jgi:uncharacterized membrane protein